MAPRRSAESAGPSGSGRGAWGRAAARRTRPTAKFALAARRLFGEVRLSRRASLRGQLQASGLSHAPAPLANRRLLRRMSAQELVDPLQRCLQRLAGLPLGDELRIRRELCQLL